MLNVSVNKMVFSFKKHHVNPDSWMQYRESNRIVNWHTSKANLTAPLTTTSMTNRSVHVIFVYKFWQGLLSILTQTESLSIKLNQCCCLLCFGDWSGAGKGGMGGNVLYGNNAINLTLHKVIINTQAKQQVSHCGVSHEWWSCSLPPLTACTEDWAQEQRGCTR